MNPADVDGVSSLAALAVGNRSIALRRFTSKSNTFIDDGSDDVSDTIFQASLQRILRTITRLQWRSLGGELGNKVANYIISCLLKLIQLLTEC